MLKGTKLFRSNIFRLGKKGKKKLFSVPMSKADEKNSQFRALKKKKEKINLNGEMSGTRVFQ